ncbi:MAG: MBL fold metallo-hydrolase [Aigarchaeota archaeon]|nr:MBL fold metallo-hydrolase [Aigarchaeota archaeon]MCX8192902.1 MBL fold metallo-hydrolase [Nitrososphaeria archaeon]MDW7986453.1 MBL fold metallo-hydrolase [Nitrososphaerota archaeon]
MPYVYGGLEISWLGHDSFYVKYSDKRLYFDPYKIKPKDKASHVFVSHDHFDHLSLEDLRKIVAPNTNIIAPESCRKILSSLKIGIMNYVKVDDELKISEVGVKVVPAYNLTKFREPGVVYHPKAAGGVGYIVDVGGVKIYHMGDTDFVPEMKNLTADIVFVPISGTFVMTAEEAAQAVNEIKPKVAIPMHYGAIVGSSRDVEEFKKRAKVEVVVLEKE